MYSHNLGKTVYIQVKHIYWYDYMYSYDTWYGQVTFELLFSHQINNSILKWGKANLNFSTFK